MIKHKIKAYLGLSCLSLSLFASCSKEIEQFDSKAGATNTTKNSQENDNVGESISISMSADMLDNELRSVGFTLTDRGNNYSNEYKPSLRANSPVQYVFLVLVKEGDPKSLYTQRVLFNRVKNGSDQLDPRKIYYRGEVKLPAGYSLADEGEWYAMGLINYDYSSVDNGSRKSYVRYGNSGDQDANVVETDSRINLSSSTLLNGALNSTGNISSAPFISQWKKLKKIESAVEGSSTGAKLYTAEIEGLVFKPQGILLQYDFGDNIHEQKDIRRHAIVTNTLAFSGSYDLSESSLYQRFLSRDINTGVGMPEWKEDPANKSGYKLYRYKGGNPLAIGEQIYPWDVPAASDALTNTIGLPESQLEEIALDGDAHGIIRAPWYETNTKQWRFAPSSAGTRKVGFIWGMPRKTSPAKPYTYFLASSYDRLEASDNFQSDIEPNRLEIKITEYDNYHFAKDQVTEIANKIQDYNSKISSYEVAPSNESETAKAERLRKLKETKILLESAKVNEQLLQDLLAKRTQEIGGSYDKATEDKARADIKDYYARLRKMAIQQVTPRTQPLVVLHQTNTSFTTADNGKVRHAQSVLTSDLMFSELIYKQMEDGKAYTIAEIHNPTADYVDLRQYAIARLIPNGDHLSYRRADGSATDDLAQALIMPLSVVDPEVTDPFAPGTYMESWKGDKGRYDRLNENIQGAFTSAELYPKYDRWNILRNTNGSALYDGMVRSGYPQKSTFFQSRFKDDGMIPLGQSQTILLGGGKFLERVSLQKYTNSIDWDRLPDELKYSEKLARWAMAYNDGERKQDNTLGEGTLDFKPGEGLVLLKKQPGYGGWQVIDATAPIGPHGLGYSGTYATFKALFNGKTEFSFRRVNHVHFPCIFPFRTKSTRTDGQADDWVTDDLNLSSNTMGYRNSDKSNRSYTPTMDWSWLRTPLDFQYATYRTNIPR